MYHTLEKAGNARDLHMWCNAQGNRYNPARSAAEMEMKRVTAEVVSWRTAMVVFLFAHFVSHKNEA